MSQTTRLLDLLSDGQPHSTIEILDFVYGGSHLGIARAGARINDLVKLGYVFLDEEGNEIHGVDVPRGWKDRVNPSIYWYWLKVEVSADQYKTQATFLTDNQYTAA